VINCSYLGGGTPPTGTNVLFTYRGADPNVGSVSTIPPRGVSGSVAIDSANKQVLLVFAPIPKGTQYMIR
jgi:hypothetical protein